MQVDDLARDTAAKRVRQHKRKDSGVIVPGVENMLIRLSKCCNPVPGDEIVGFITKGRGVSVHRADCLNVHTEDSENRLIPVEWETHIKEGKEFNVEIEISGYDRRGLLNEVLQAVNETKTNISAVSGRRIEIKWQPLICQSLFITLVIFIKLLNELSKFVISIRFVVLCIKKGT